MLSGSTPLSPDDQFLQEQALDAARAIHRLPESESSNYKEIIREITDREGIQGDRLRRFQERVRQQLNALKEKARSDKETAMLKQFDGRFLLIDGQFFPAGMPRNFKVTVDAWKGPLKRFRKVSINAKNLDTAVTELADLDAQIAEYQSEIDDLKAALLDEKATKDLIKAMRTAARETSGILSRPYLMAGLTVWRQQKAAKSGFPEKVKDLEKKSKKLQERRDYLRKALNDVNKKQDQFRKIFQTTFGKRVRRLLEHKDRSNYEPEVAKLREEVRNFGKGAGYVYFEFFLNEALSIQPAVLLTEAELEGQTKPAYEYPKNDVEKKAETEAVDKWWKDTFGRPAQPDVVNNIIVALRQEAPAMLGKIVKKDMKRGIQAILKFFFTGEYTTPDGRPQKLPDNRRKTLGEKAVVDMLKKAPEYVKIANNDMWNLQKAFFEFCNYYDNLTPEQFEQVLRYPLALDVNPTEKDFRKYAKYNFTAQDLVHDLSITPETRMEIEQAGDKILLGNFHGLNRQSIETYKRLKSNVPNLENAIQIMNNEFSNTLTHLGLPMMFLSKSSAWIRQRIAEEAHQKEINGGQAQDVLHDSTILENILAEKLADDTYRLYKSSSDPADQRHIENFMNNNNLSPAKGDQVRGLLQLDPEHNGTLSHDNLLTLGALIMEASTIGISTPSTPPPSSPAPGGSSTPPSAGGVTRYRISNLNP